MAYHLCAAAIVQDVCENALILRRNQNECCQ